MRSGIDDRPDATAGVADEASLAEDRVGWTLAASASSDAPWFWHASRNVLRISTRCEEILGYAPGAFDGTLAALRRHFSATDLPALEAQLEQLIGGTQRRLEVDTRIITASGSRRWVTIRARARRSADGRVEWVGGVVRDIEKRKRAELQLQAIARRDPLTGLPNRGVLESELAARLARADRDARPFVLLYVDLDRFKVINDTLGHPTGDALLEQVAERLAAALQPADLLSRIGGDEFALLLDGTDVAGAQSVAERLHAALRAPILAGGREIFTTMSIGVSTRAADSTRPSDVIRDADIAMYRAKRHGGARTVVFDTEMRLELEDRLRVHTELHRALHLGQFWLAYQPVFATADRALCGFEALIRWEHPERGSLPAGEFVTQANESGLIVRIGRWVLREACAQLAEWTRAYPRARPLSIAVNICDRELLDPTFTRSVEQALLETSLPPSQLILEMTEGVMTASTRGASDGLRYLRDIGVRLQMDDFGRGYSSLRALREFPITAIKIDRSFIADLETNPESRAIVRSIASLAHALGLDVIAEGVERAEQEELLREIDGCRYMQGHLYGRPADQRDAQGMLPGARCL